MSKFKIFLYNNLLRYKISYKSNLGLFCILVADSLEINAGVKIGLGVIVLDCHCVRICESSKIYRFCYISGLEKFFVNKNTVIGAKTTIYSRFYDRSLFHINDGGLFVIGNNSVIGSNHYYEASGRIIIGSNVVIGGLYTQFFTHSYDCYRNFSYGNISIGDNVYIGSSSIVLAGIRICDDVVIGAGSLVCKSCDKPGIYAGNPITKINNNPTINPKFIQK